MVGINTKNRPESYLYLDPVRGRNKDLNNIRRNILIHLFLTHLYFRTGKTTWSPSNYFWRFKLTSSAKGITALSGARKKWQTSSSHFSSSPFPVSFTTCNRTTLCALITEICATSLRKF